MATTGDAEGLDTRFFCWVNFVFGEVESGGGAEPFGEEEAEWEDRPNENNDIRFLPDAAVAVFSARGETEAFVAPASCWL